MVVDINAAHVEDLECSLVDGWCDGIVDAVVMSTSSFVRLGQSLLYHLPLI